MRNYTESGSNRSGCWQEAPESIGPVCPSPVPLAPRVRLNAATGGAGPLPLINTVLSDPINVVSVPIDTTGMVSPGVLLTFTGTICLPVGALVTLNFQINRSTNDGAAKVGPTYTFATLVNVLEAEAFSFQFFDSPVNPEHYTYAVELSTNSVIEVTPGLTIQNATLSALAVDNG